jgi:hypothetical protein
MVHQLPIRLLVLVLLVMMQRRVPATAGALQPLADAAAPA